MIVVFGATGHVGRATVRELVARGAAVTAVSREPQRAASSLGVPAVGADLDDAASVAAALRGASAALVLSPHSLRQAAHQGAIVDAAMAAGVTRLVKVSALPAAVRSDAATLVGRLHHATEMKIRRSGIPFTFVRPTPFQQNLVEWLDTAARGHALMLPFGRARVAMVDARDVGAVCAVALLQDSDRCDVHEVTGPESLDMSDAVHLLGNAVGRRLRYRPVPAALAAFAQKKRGVEGWLADHQAALGRLVAAGEASRVTTSVADVTGRPAQRLADTLGQLRAA